VVLFQNLPPVWADDVVETPVSPFALVFDADNPRRAQILLGWKDSDAPASPVWSYSFASGSERRRVFEALELTPAQIALWGRLTMLLGREAVDAMVERQVEVLDQDRRDAMQSRREARAAYKRVELYVRDEGNRFILDLERDSESKPEWSIRFAGKSERDRLCDWLRWQRGRFGEFLDYARAHGAKALERRLIDEMFEAEQRVKEAGKSAGGVRPLRMWRGE
jgi:hypothetical protein